MRILLAEKIGANKEYSIIEYKNLFTLDLIIFTYIEWINYIQRLGIEYLLWYLNMIWTLTLNEDRDKGGGWYFKGYLLPKQLIAEPFRLSTWCWFTLVTLEKFICPPDWHKRVITEPETLFGILFLYYHGNHFELKFYFAAYINCNRILKYWLTHPSQCFQSTCGRQNEYHQLMTHIKWFP